MHFYQTIRNAIVVGIEKGRQICSLGAFCYAWIHLVSN